MKRPDLAILACVNAECQLFHHAGADNLVIRKVYGHDCLRLLRCRICREEFSERWGSALFNPKLPEAKAADVISHLNEGCSVRATARLVHVAKGHCQVVEGETLIRQVRAFPRSHPPFRPPAPCP